MTVSDVLVVVLALLAEFSLVAVVVRLFPGLASAVLGSSARRNDALDGLRGIVALCVVASHCIIGWTYLTTGILRPAAGNLANQLGSCSVAIFFMISAYLFGDKIVRDGGALRLLPFVEGRIMRIVPLYAACLLAITIIAFAHAGFRLAEPGAVLARHVVRWMAFDFVFRPPLNGDPATLNLFGQVWTLRYEWMLYASLPFLALAVRRAGAAWPLVAGLALGSAIWPLFAFFAAGAACALLARADGPFARRAWQLGGVAGLVFVAGFQHECAGWRQALPLIPFMVAVVQGHRGFALLGARPLRFLGEISYSVYLGQGFAFALVDHPIAWMPGGEPARFATFGAQMTVAVVLATGSFLLVERPTMALRPLSALARRLAPAGGRRRAAAGALSPAGPATPPAT